MQHLTGKEPISKVCDQHKIHPNQFREWQKILFDNATKSFESEKKTEEDRLRAEIAKLQAKLQKKDEVLAELMEEHLKVKKNYGDLFQGKDG
jgi:transposase-like protein